MTDKIDDEDNTVAIPLEPKSFVIVISDREDIDGFNCSIYHTWDTEDPDYDFYKHLVGGLVLSSYSYTDDILDLGVEFHEARDTAEEKQLASKELSEAEEKYNGQVIPFDAWKKTRH